MFVKVIHWTIGGNAAITMRCPACRHIGTFEAIRDVPDIQVKHNGTFHFLGQRKCPNAECNSHVFVVLNQDRKPVRSYPPERVDFDPTNIPQRILSTFIEAISCHAESCFVASAIMIRRCLEELCEDKQATGSNLKDRLKALQSKVLLPSELFSALDELRLLGNDAAHLEAKTYDQIGKEEIEVALELTKEILKAVYQLESLVQRLRALKKP